MECKEIIGLLEKIAPPCYASGWDNCGLLVGRDNKDIKNIEDYVLYIDPEDIAMTDELDDDSLYNSYIKTGKFYVYNIHDPENKIEMSLKNVKEIFIDDEATELMNANKGVIPFSQMDDDTNLFSMLILNRELTAPLYQSN